MVANEKHDTNAQGQVENVAPITAEVEQVLEAQSEKEQESTTDISSATLTTMTTTTTSSSTISATTSTSSVAATNSTEGKVKRLSLVTSEDLKTPTIAVPTVAVAAGSLAVWGAVLYFGAYKQQISSRWSFPLMTAACFASFTPVHDGTHSSIAKGRYKKVVNNVVGYLSGIPLCLPFGVYRELHLLHHRYTNTAKDPDVWDSQGPMVVRVLKWFWPDVFWIKAVVMREAKVKTKKVVESGVFYGLMFWMMRRMNGRGMDFVKYWLIPQRAAYWLLVWLFAYVPHRPDGDHQYSHSENIYKMTNVTGGILRSDGLNLAVPLLNQHLHNIHHLYPQLPFTHYGHIWSKYKDELIAAGTEIHPVYSAKQDWKWDENWDGSKRSRA